MKRRLGVASDTGNRLPLHRSAESQKERKRRSGVSGCSLGIYFLFAAIGVFSLFHLSGIFVESSLPFFVPRPSESRDWDLPLVHIVNTRFMQEQGNLTSLAKARLSLFQTFCLPTMRAQTSQSFLWIIKTDPDLDRSILAALVQELRPFPNFYLVASNKNFRVNENFPGGWRDGAEVEDLSRSRVYSGNQTLLEQAMALHHRTDPYPIVETRLDADDGLHIQFLETIQTLAMRAFHPSNKNADVPRWLYWCSRRHIEWHFSETLLGSEPIWKQITTFGALSGIQHEKLCITPGFSVGFPTGVAESDVPIHAHDKVIEQIRSMPREDACGLPNSKDCLQFVENFVFEAIRSRSPTSAGMLRVEIVPKEIATDPWLYYAYMNMIHGKFGISQQHLSWMNRYLSDHMIEIARDNLLGQCTTGHSCKVSNLLLYMFDTRFSSCHWLGLSFISF